MRPGLTRRRHSPVSSRPVVPHACALIRGATAHSLKLWGGLAALVLSGCSWLHIPEAEPPAVPPRWQYAEALEVASQGRTGFWQSLGDPQLPGILLLAMRDNDDIKLASLQVKLARVQAALVATNAWPGVSLGATAGQSRNLTAQGGYPPTTSSSAGLGLGVNYQADLWGNQAAQQEAADINAQASEADWNAARITLQVSVAQLWWQLGFLNRVMSNALTDLNEARTTLKLASVRYETGATSRTDMVFAQQALVSQQVSVAQSRQTLIEARSAFALIMGATPEEAFPELEDLLSTPLPVPQAGIPAELLARRPDVHAAELRVRSYLASVQASKLSFYPTLALTGSLGTSSPTLTQYLINPVAAVSAAVTLPFIQFNTFRLSVQSSRLAYDSAVISFKKTLYTALKNTEDALSARQQLIIQEQYLRQYVVLSREAERLSQVRWQVGETDIQPWLDAQATRRQAELSLLQNTLARKQNAAQLYAALGGDYQVITRTP
ncbi:TolC family protein [Pseudomonas helleri]|uniref:TolC family protein n=1 Tax=Pseudomonas helleri TaxID=1608996 RepID=UPI0021C57FFD|nr:TolC family protein [Pseudomonas helleri]MCU1754741.1 TolC family protein [Pseudomonas helleri]